MPDDPTPPCVPLPPPTTVEAYDLLTRMAELSSDCPKDVRQEIRGSIEPGLRHHIQAVSSKAGLRELTRALDGRYGEVSTSLTGVHTSLTGVHTKLDTLVAALEATEVATAVQQVGGTVIGTVPSIVPVFGGRALTWNHVLLILFALVAASAMGIDVAALVTQYTGVSVPTLEEPAEPAKTAHPEASGP